MPLPRKDVSDLGRCFARMPIVCRVQAFNEVVPWLRSIAPRYSIVDFYEIVFSVLDEESSKVRWDNVKAQAVVAEVDEV